MVLKGKTVKRLKGIFQEIAKRYEFDIDTMELMEDRFNLFLSVTLIYVRSDIARIIKSVSATIVFNEFNEVKE